MKHFGSPAPFGRRQLTSRLFAALLVEARKTHIRVAAGRPEPLGPLGSCFSRFGVYIGFRALWPRWPPCCCSLCRLSLSPTASKAQSAEAAARRCLCSWTPPASRGREGSVRKTPSKPAGKATGRRRGSRPAGLPPWPGLGKIAVAQGRAAFRASGAESTGITAPHISREESMRRLLLFHALHE